MAEVKICGISDRAGMAAVAAARVEWVGFVFFPPSPRAVTAGEAAGLWAGGAGVAQPVGLFVEPSDAEIAAVLEVVPLAALQVHGSLARAGAVQARFGVPVWWAVGVAAAADLPDEAPGVARVLLDRKAPAGAAIPGGNATAFDWGVLAGWRAPAPWVLAGGLTPGNVAGAIRATGAAVVDVSSGVERARGVKDAGLIGAFVAAVRGAGR